MPHKKYKILMVAAECSPLAKAGGLGDVIGSLPVALNKIGCDTRVLLPFHDLINRRKFKAKKIHSGLPVIFNNRKQLVNIWQLASTANQPTIYLLENKKNFSGPEIYGAQNKEKFLFFSLACVQILPILNFKPDIIHGHDYHAGLIPFFLKKNSDAFTKIKTIFTIHNLAYQGKSLFNIVGNKLIPVRSKKQGINFMAQGINNADIVTTVSPTYAKEILTPEFGEGLDSLLRQRRKDVYGIINGLDTKFFNPTADKLIAKTFTLKNLKLKIKNKNSLQKKIGLPVDKNIALIGVVSRLATQKGLDLITEDMIKLLNPPGDQAGCQIVILGTGHKDIENTLKNIAKKYPHQISIQTKFDEELAHLIYAGSDIFLMPSRFEPCGLGQMIAMRYGTVPVVRSTGGLADTVAEFKVESFPPEADLPRAEKLKVNDANGFMFKKFTSNDLLKILKKALDVYYNYPLVWKKLQINGMKQDFSWAKPAKEYLRLYKKLI